MKKVKSCLKSLLPYMLSFMLLVPMSACDRANEQHDNTDAKLEEVEKDVKQAGEKVEKGLKQAGKKIQDASKDVSSELEESKDKFVASTREEIKELDARIEKLRARINARTKEAKKDANKAGRETKGEMQEELKILELKRKNLDRQLENLENSTQSVWQDMKKGITDAVNDLKQAADKVEDKANNDGKN